MASKSVFLIGPGFIGWNVLDLLVAEDYSVTTLVRRKEHGEQIEKCGAKVVYGGLDDDEIVQKGVVEHQVNRLFGFRSDFTWAVLDMELGGPRCGESGRS